MRRRKLDSIARHWWSEVPRAEQRVDHIVAHNRALAPGLIRALVSATPLGRQVSFVGTSIVEDLQLTFEYQSKNDQTIEILRRAELTSDELFLVLAGVWPHLLEGMDIRHRLEGILPADKLDWLVTREAPGRSDYL